MLPPDSVLITENDGTVTGIVNEKDAGDDVQVLDGILSPGFINTHCHIELSHMKGLIPPGTGLVHFVQQVMSNRNASSVEERLAAMQDAERELYRSGTVAVGDICNGVDSLPLKQNSPLYWHNFIEVSGFIDALAEKRLAAAGEVLAAFRHLLPAFKSSLAPHAAYSVSGELFRLLNDSTANQVTSIHNQEALAENELYETKTGEFLDLYKNFGIDISGFTPAGKTSVQSWAPRFTHGQQVISVHNTFTSAKDLDFIKEQDAGFFFCICANANLYIENALPPLALLMESGSVITMGTDSYASNWQLNLMEEIRTVQKYFPKIALATILQWATLNGARALGIADRFGSFEKGKKPGLVLINEQSGSSKLVQ